MTVPNWMRKQREQEIRANLFATHMKSSTKNVRRNRTVHMCVGGIWVFVCLLERLPLDFCRTQILIHSILFDSALYCCCCCCCSLVYYGLNGIFMQTNHKLNIVLIILSLWVSVCLYFLFYALSGLIMPTMRIHTRPPHTHTHTHLFVCIWFVMLPLIVVLRCGSETEKPATATTTETRSFSMGSGQIFNLFVMVVSVTVWIAWQLNCNMPKVNVEHRAKGVCCVTTTTTTRAAAAASTAHANSLAHKQNDGQIPCSHTQLTHYQHCKSNWYCDDSLVLTPSIPLILFNMGILTRQK